MFSVTNWKAELFEWQGWGITWLKLIFEIAYFPISMINVASLCLGQGSGVKNDAISPFWIGKEKRGSWQNSRDFGEVECWCSCSLPYISFCFLNTSSLHKRHTWTSKTNMRNATFLIWQWRKNLRHYYIFRSMQHIISLLSSYTYLVSTLRGTRDVSERGRVWGSQLRTGACTQSTFVKTNGWNGDILTILWTNY